MKQVLIIVGYTLLTWSASASDVYVVTDSRGKRVYTDRAEQLPAEEVSVRTSPTDVAKAGQLTADDLAKRCADAHRRYEVTMSSSRLYEQAPNGERRYLSSEEINVARINTKQTMDTFCGDQ